MTTLRRILMATKQEQAVIPEIPPRRKPSRKSFEDEKELELGSFEHHRNGYKRKRKEISNSREKSRKEKMEKSKHKKKFVREDGPSPEKTGRQVKPKSETVEKKEIPESDDKDFTEKEQGPKEADGITGVPNEENKASGHDEQQEKHYLEKSSMNIEESNDTESPVSSLEENTSAVVEERKSQNVSRDEKESPLLIETSNHVNYRNIPNVEHEKKESNPEKEISEQHREVQTLSILKESDSSNIRIQNPTDSTPEQNDDSSREPSVANETQDFKQDQVLETSPMRKADTSNKKTEMEERERANLVENEDEQPKKLIEDIKDKKPDEFEKRCELEAVETNKTSSINLEEKVENKVEPSSIREGDDDSKRKGIILARDLDGESKMEKKRKRDDSLPEAKTETTTTSTSRPPKREASKNCPGTLPLPNDETKDANIEDKSSLKGKKSWVLCERCKTWRELPATVDPSKLPDLWYCEMNKWDPKNSKCVTEKECKKPTKPVLISAEKNKKRSRSGADKSSRTGSARRAKGSGSSGRHRVNSILSGSTTPNSKINPSQWVMCETCHQWRKVPPEVDCDKLPEKWYCSMNKWDPARASCSAPQEADDTEAAVGDGKRKYVTLPEGVHMYGGNIWPVQKKQPPMNYRELIVNHYRNFKQWELASSKILNQRYNGTSLFIPRDIMRVKASKSGAKKSSPISPKKARCISRNAFIEESLFSKFFHLSKQVENIDRSNNITSETIKGSEFDKYFSNSTSGVPLLKLSKPWKRAGLAWDKEKNYFCTSS